MTPGLKLAFVLTVRGEARPFGHVSYAPNAPFYYTFTRIAS
jgi:hypothetical protein